MIKAPSLPDFEDLFDTRITAPDEMGPSSVVGGEEGKAQALMQCGLGTRRYWRYGVEIRGMHGTTPVSTMTSFCVVVSLEATGNVDEELSGTSYVSLHRCADLRVTDSLVPREWDCIGDIGQCRRWGSAASSVD